MEKTLDGLVQFRRGTADEWKNSSRIPRIGEPCYETDTGIVKIGDGVHTFKDLPESGGNAAHYEGTKQTGESDNDVILRVLTELSASANADDIFIVKELLTEDKYSYTAYVYNGTDWAAMDGNYNAKNIYFDQNLMFTHQFGKFKPDSTGSVTIPAHDDGLSLYDILMKSYSEEVNPGVTKPTVSFTSGNQSGEVGAAYTLPTATLKVTSVGNYTYGAKDAKGTSYSAEDTGVTFAVGDVTLTQGKNTKTNESVMKKNGTLTITATADGDIIFSDSPVTYSFSASAAYTESDRVPVSNLGNKVDSLKIKSGTLSPTCSATMTGWRKMFMGTVTDASTEITSDIIRGLKLVNKQVATAAQTFTVPVGAAKIIVAAPTGYTVSKVEYFTMSWEEFAGFTTSPAVEVADARGGTNGLKEYNVFTYTPASPFEADTQFRITLKKA